MPPPRPAEHRARPHRRNVFGLALILALLLHLLLLLPLHRKSIGAPEEVALLPVTILPPPPPPPAPPVAGGARESGAIVEPKADKLAINALGKPEPTPPVRRPTPRDAPEPRAKAAPRAETKVVQAPAPEGAERGLTGGVLAGTAGGVVGGQLGGQVDGTVGGVVGGTGDGPIPIDRVASPPTVIDQVQPVYPPVARARSLEGVVMIELIVGREGRVEEDSITVTKSAPAFDAAAMAAVRRWRFRPGRDEERRAVRVILEVPIRFRLR